MNRSERKRSKKLKKEIPQEESSNQENANEEETTALVIAGANVEPKRTIDDDINELIAQIPPLDRLAIKEWRKMHRHGKIVCTCKLIEVSESELATATEANKESEDKILNDSMAENRNIQNDSAKLLSDRSMDVDNLLSEGESLNESSSTSAATEAKQQAKENICAIATSTGVNIGIEPPPPAKKPTVKSIFDLDYEEDEDPIHTFKLNNNNIISNDKIKSCDDNILNENAKESTTINSNIPLITTTSKSNSNFAKMESDQSDDEGELIAVTTPPVPESNGNKLPSITIPQPEENAQQQQRLQELQLGVLPQQQIDPMLPLKQYRIVEDELCKAKEFYVTSKQSITEYHIDHLHNSCIPNVNGNWDDADCEVAKTIKLESDKETSTVDKTIETKIITATNVDCEVKNEPSEDVAVAIQSDDVLAILTDLEKCEQEPRITEASVGLYERVVPLCNHIVMDRLLKNVRNVNLDFAPSDEVNVDEFMASIATKNDDENDNLNSVDHQISAAILVEQHESRSSPDENFERVQTNDNVSGDDDIFELKTQNEFNNNDLESNEMDCSIIGESPPLSMEIDVADENRMISSYSEEMKCLSPAGSVQSIQSVHDDNNFENTCVLDGSIQVDRSMHKISYTENEADYFCFRNNDEEVPNIIVDDNARAEAELHDLDTLHHIVDSNNSNSSHLPPANDENAVDFDNQLSKSFDMIVDNTGDDELKNDDAAPMSDLSASHEKLNGDEKAIADGGNDGREHISDGVADKHDQTANTINIEEDRHNDSLLEVVNDVVIEPEESTSDSEENKKTIEPVAPKPALKIVIPIKKANNEKPIKTIKYKIRRNSIDSNDGINAGKNAIDVMDKQSGNGKLILKLSRQLTTENDNDNEYDPVEYMNSDDDIEKPSGETHDGELFILFLLEFQ